MMFQLFKVIADRVREQAADFADAQARIGQRTVTSAFDPFGLTAMMAEQSPVSTPPVGTELCPPTLKSERRVRRNARPAEKRRLRQRPALNFA